jgi:hypothetical protein
MATRIAPPVNKEPEPAQPPRRNTAPPPRFVPPTPPRQSAQPATASAAAQAQRQKQQRSVLQERSAAAGLERAERLVEQGPGRAGNDQDQHPIQASSNDAPDYEGPPTSQAESGDSGRGGCLTCQEGNDLAGAGEGSLDPEALAEELLPHTGDDGIFEVTLPNGKKMGVAVNIQPGAVRFHLSTSDEKLGERLRQRKMELQGHLERRIQRNVDITVL